MFSASSKAPVLANLKRIISVWLKEAIEYVCRITTPMCMGFGCNAVGVTGCRIIDSKRERLIAMLTNSFVPCNGKFPILISILTIFFVGNQSGIFASVWSAVLLTGLIVLGVGMTFLASRFLSQTVLKGDTSAFTLELPPYRRPQIGKVIVRSILDRTIFVLGRAMAVAAPAGLLIWIMANTSYEGTTILSICASWLDPFGRMIGMDGIILLAFILGFPANEIVIPVMLMAYLSQGTLVEAASFHELKNILTANGWTWITAINVLLFTMMHWPCSTTCITVRKESGSFKWTLAAFCMPALSGVLICFVFTSIVRIFNLN